jgi:hypothetical protein
VSEGAGIFFHLQVTCQVPKIKCVSIFRSTGQLTYPSQFEAQPGKKEYF